MSLSRRNLITAGTCHIASLLVQCKPENMDDIELALTGLDGTEVPLRDAAGKLVVLLELSTEYELLERTQQIESLSGVISVTMVYHQLDEPE